MNSTEQPTRPAVNDSLTVCGRAATVTAVRPFAAFTAYVEDLDTEDVHAVRQSAGAVVTVRFTDDGTLCDTFTS